jgi:hypothetical protein
MRRTAGAALLLGSLLAVGSAGAAEKLAPELLLAGKINNKPIYLEDFRGYLTVLCFYNDDSS